LSFGWHSFLVEIALARDSRKVDLSYETLFFCIADCEIVLFQCELLFCELLLLLIVGNGWGRWVLLLT
jgi:hypothetical protein